MVRETTQKIPGTYLHIVHAAGSHQPMMAVVSVDLVAHAAEQTVPVALHRHYAQATASKSARVVFVSVGHGSVGGTVQAFARGKKEGSQRHPLCT